MSLHVKRPGLHTLLVDFGRPRTRSLGVPVGGAADRAALMLGNALVGNPPEASALEITLTGPTLQADEDLACVVYGAPFELAIEKQTVAPGVTFTLPAGQELHIGTTPTQARAYFCVRGGFLTKPILGSSSAVAPLEAGAVLACSPGQLRPRFVRPAVTWNHEPRTLRALEGAQAAWFSPDDFYGQEFTVTPASSRMGLRLHGPALPLPEQELLSEPVCPGTVQVTRDGQCVVLGVDGQTIGGYPKIAQVITADVDKLGQLRPGDRIRFQQVDLQEAERVYRQKQAELHEWIVRLQTTEPLALPLNFTASRPPT
jgi:antagonist of KipI